MRKKVENALFELGITPNLVGFDYICRAVDIISNSKERKRVFYEVYPQIAEEFDTTASRVERGIRSAFSKVDTKSEAFSKYLNTGNPTNAALLYTLAYRLKED